MTFFFRWNFFLKSVLQTLSSFFHSNFPIRVFFRYKLKTFVLRVDCYAMRASDRRKNLSARNKKHILLIKYAEKADRVEPTVPCMNGLRHEKRGRQKKIFLVTGKMKRKSHARKFKGGAKCLNCLKWKHYAGN